jgi:hypothetical protein
MNEDNVIEWPLEFSHDDSFVWRNHSPELSDEKRMELIVWYCNLNYNLIANWE